MRRRTGTISLFEPLPKGNGTRGYNLPTSTQVDSFTEHEQLLIDGFICINFASESELSEIYKGLKKVAKYTPGLDDHDQLNAYYHAMARTLSWGLHANLVLVAFSKTLRLHGEELARQLKGYTALNEALDYLRSSLSNLFTATRKFHPLPGGEYLDVIITAADHSFLNLLAAAGIIFLFETIARIADGDEEDGKGTVPIPGKQLLKRVLAVDGTVVMIEEGPRMLMLALPYFTSLREFLDAYAQVLIKFGLDPHTKLPAANRNGIFIKELKEEVFQRLLVVLGNPDLPDDQQHEVKVVVETFFSEANKKGYLPTKVITPKDLEVCPAYIASGGSSQEAKSVEARMAFRLIRLEEATEARDLIPRGAVDIRAYLTDQVEQALGSDLKKLGQLPGVLALEQISVPAQDANVVEGLSSQKLLSWVAFYFTCKQHLGAPLPYLTPEILAGLKLLRKEFREELALRKEGEERDAMEEDELRDPFKTIHNIRIYNSEVEEVLSRLADLKNEEGELQLAEVGESTDAGADADVEMIDYADMEGLLNLEALSKPELVQILEITSFSPLREDKARAAAQLISNNGGDDDEASELFDEIRKAMLEVYKEWEEREVQPVTEVTRATKALLSAKTTEPWKQLGEVLKGCRLHESYPPLTAESYPTPTGYRGDLGEDLIRFHMELLEAITEVEWDHHMEGSSSLLYKTMLALADPRFGDLELTWLVNLIKETPSVLMLPLSSLERGGRRGAWMALDLVVDLPFQSTEAQVTLLDVIALAGALPLLEDRAMELGWFTGSGLTKASDLFEIQAMLSFPKRAQLANLMELAGTGELNETLGFTDPDEHAIVLLFVDRCQDLWRLLAPLAEELFPRHPPLKRYWGEVLRGVQGLERWRGTDLGGLTSPRLLLEAFGQSGAAFASVHCWPNPIYRPSENLLTRTFSPATWLTLACFRHEHTELAREVLRTYLRKHTWSTPITEIASLRELIEALANTTGELSKGRLEGGINHYAMHSEFASLFPKDLPPSIQDALTSPSDLDANLKGLNRMPTNLQVMLWMEQGQGTPLTRAVLADPWNYLDILAAIYGGELTIIKGIWEKLSSPAHPEHGLPIPLTLDHLRTGLISWPDIVAAHSSEETLSTLHELFYLWLGEEAPQKEACNLLLTRIREAAATMATKNEALLIHLTGYYEGLYLADCDLGWETRITRRQQTRRLLEMVQQAEGALKSWKKDPKDLDKTFYLGYTTRLSERLGAISKTLEDKIKDWAQVPMETNFPTELRPNEKLRLAASAQVAEIITELQGLEAKLTSAMNHITRSPSNVVTLWWMVAAAYHVLSVFDRLEGFEITSWHPLKHALLNFMASADGILGIREGTVQQALGNRTFFTSGASIGNKPVESLELILSKEAKGGEPSFYDIIQWAYFFYLPDLSGLDQHALIDMIIPDELVDSQNLTNDPLIPQQLRSAERLAQALAWIYTHSPDRIIQDLQGDPDLPRETRRRRCLNRLACLFAPACANYLRWVLVSTVINFPALDIYLLRDWISLMSESDHPFTPATARMIMDTFHCGSSTHLDSDLIRQVRLIGLWTKGSTISAVNRFRVVERLAAISKMLQMAAASSSGTAARSHTDLDDDQGP